MRRYNLYFIICLLILSFLVSCGGSGSSSISTSGKTTVSINLGETKTASRANGKLQNASATIPSSIINIRFTISAADMATIERTIAVSGSTTITESFDVPNGANRHFLAEAMNSAGNVLYRGDTYADMDGTAITLTITMVSTDTTSSVTITLKNIPSTAKTVNLSVTFSGQDTYSANFTYNTPINSTITETINLSGAYTTYSLAANAELDMNSDGTNESAESIAITDKSFSSNISADFGLPSAISIKNVPSTAKVVSLTVAFNSQDTKYEASFHWNSPFDYSALNTTNVVSGAYTTYSLAANAELDMNNDGIVDDTKNIAVTDQPFSENVTVDFGL